jgi:membrane protease YdiL (CAAX protease family)
MPQVYQREVTPFAAAAWSTAVVLAMGLVLALLMGGRLDVELDLMTVGLAAAFVHLAISFAAVRVHAPEGSLRVLFGVGDPKALDAALGVVAGVCIVPLLDWLDGLAQRRFPPKADETLADALMFANATGGQRLKIALVIVVLLPVAQELFFRGIIFSGLAARAGGRTLVATFVSTVAFALTSSSPRAILQMAVLGLVLACVRAWSGSVVVSTLAHAGYFVIPVLPLLQGKAYDTTIKFSLKQAIAMTAVAAIALVVLRIRGALGAKPS